MDNANECEILNLNAKKGNKFVQHNAVFFHAIFCAYAAILTIIIFYVYDKMFEFYRKYNF